MKVCMAGARTLLAAVAIFAASATTASATESALGRYMPGVFTLPGAGIVPPTPGFYWQNSSFYYHGSASRSLGIPTGGDLQFGMSADFASTTFTGLWVPGLEVAEGLTPAISVSIPVQHMDTSASLGSFGTQDDVTGIGDIMFAPTLGWQSGTNFLSASLRIYAPTGKYEQGALANIGMNYWTFSPTIAFTHIDMQRGLDFSVTAGIDINTENSETDYKSGAMAHVDASMIQNFPNKFGIGVFGSILYQLEDDEGALADRLDGFRGRSFAIGPILRYTAGTDENPINMSLSWAPEFGVDNRLEGNGLYFNISGTF